MLLSWAVSNKNNWYPPKRIVQEWLPGWELWQQNSKLGLVWSGAETIARHREKWRSNVVMPLCPSDNITSITEPAVVAFLFSLSSWKTFLLVLQSCRIQDKSNAVVFTLLVVIWNNRLQCIHSLLARVRAAVISCSVFCGIIDTQYHQKMMEALAKCFTARNVVYIIFWFRSKTLFFLGHCTDYRHHII